MASINERVTTLETAVAAAARACGRNRDEISIIAASKTKTAHAINAAFDAGMRHFGENYLQEAVPKIQALANLEATWHYIGAIQSNKTRLIATHFHWVHTVERAKIAARLSAQCPVEKELNVCLQVNIDDDPDKAGVVAARAGDLLDAAQTHPNLRVRGLMTILRKETDPAEGFGALADLFKKLQPRAAGTWDTLSMGMSADYPAAIAAGATHIRIGTAVFGARESKATAVIEEQTDE
jgi:pyridoxal phosphate enzyme (YggS family)